MEVFRPEVDFRYLLDVVRSKGAAFCELVLRDEFLRRLQDEIEACRYQKVDEVTKTGVRQKYEACSLNFPPDKYPNIRTLGNLMAWEARFNRARLSSLENWLPNEVSVQRYSEPDSGIGAHRDGKSSVCLVAVFTVAGYAKFEVLKDRQGPVTYQWQLRPGSLVLLRGARLEGQEDDQRLNHRISGPIGGETRVSLGYRLRRPND